MIIKSNPFLRNDYYPDQNDIDDLNTRINEVQSDVDLLAISVNEKTEAVNGRLNNLQNDYNESFATDSLNANTANINVLNVNVQAVVKDLNAENTYIENLIVNKPVQDLSLRTPHLENTTSLNGNFYTPNILGGVFDNIQIENMQSFKAVNIEADEVIANALSAANIQVDGVIANTVNLNVLNAVNIEADEVKTNTVKTNTIDLNVLNAVNIEADEVKANKLIGDFFSAEPISSSAVVGYDENGQLIPIRASYDVSFPEYSDYLKTDAQGVARKGTSESEVVQSTNLIQAGAVQNMYNAINANFNNVQNTLSDVESNLNNVKSSVKTINDFILNGIYLPEYGLFKSDSPVTYTMARTVELYGNAQGGTAIPGGGGMIKFDSSTNTVTFGFSGAACKGIINAKLMFYGCSALNQNILIPSSVKFAQSMFAACSSLNQNILIPSSVVNAQRMFFGCRFLDQDIYIYSQVLNDMNGMFTGTKVNKHNVHIPSSVPKDTSNYIYNSLVNDYTGITFAPENIFNDLPVDPEVWPPIN